MWYETPPGVISVNRGNIAGIAVVGIVGVTLAAVAVLGGRGGAVEAPSPAEDPTSIVESKRAPNADDDWEGDEQNMLDAIAERSARLRSVPASPAGMDDNVPDGPPDPMPPPHAALLDKDMDAVFSDENELLQENPYRDLGPETSLGQLGRRVERVESSVDDLVGEYRQLAASSDPGTAIESLNRAALLYDHMSGQIPTYPPTDLNPDQMNEWVKQHDAMVQPIRDKAQALREEAVAIRVVSDELPPE
jgi:hypothetical protein